MDIELYVLPLHSTHMLQPMDVGVFAPFKKRLNSKIEQELNSSFLATGLYPFDPDVISLPGIQSQRYKALASKLKLMLNNKEQNVLNKINDNQPKKGQNLSGPVEKMSQVISF